MGRDFPNLIQVLEGEWRVTAFRRRLGLNSRWRRQLRVGLYCGVILQVSGDGGRR
jgi:hypothetical protein